MEIRNKNLNEVIYGSFMLGTLELAINAAELQDVVNYPDNLIEVPLAPDYLVGVFSLRQCIVPVIKMRALLKHDGPREEDTALLDCVAVIRVGENRLGLLFDRTSEVLRISASQVNQFDYRRCEAQSRDPVSGVISLDNGNRLVQVLDPLALMNLPDVPLSSNDPQHSDNKSKTQQIRHRCITFCSGSNRFGFRIDAVSEIIPLEPMEPLDVFSHYCLGQIELRGTRLPVLDFEQLLSNSVPAEDNDNNRIIIVKSDDQPVGLKVDSVEGIIEYVDDELQTLPDFRCGTTTFLSGCIVDQQRDISVINHDLLFALPEITAPALIIRETNNFSRNEDRQEQQSIVYTTYLVVNLGFDFVLPVAEISEIIDCPEQVITIPGAPDFIDGMFNLREKVITVVNMHELYGVNGEREEAEAKLLIVERGEWLIGLRVDGVKDIVKLRSDNEHDRPRTLMINWSQACNEDITRNLIDNKRVLPLLPLVKILDRVTPGDTFTEKQYVA